MRLARPVLVAGDDQVIVDLVADEGADRAKVEKPLGEILAKLAALIGDVGEAARRQQAPGGKETERMTAIDHGGYPRWLKSAGKMLTASWKNYDRRGQSDLTRLTRTGILGVANSARQPQHEYQHFGDRFIKLRRNFVADLDIGQRARQHLVLLDRDVMGLGELDDLRADGALALGGDPWRTGLVIVQRDRELALGIHAHSARSRKCPARAGAACGGAPSRITISPG